MILFAVCTFWGLLAIYMVSSFFTVLTYWRSGILFFVISVGGFGVLKICRDYLIVPFYRYLFGISDALSAEVIFY